MYIVGKRQGGRIKQILKHNVTESLSKFSQFLADDFQKPLTDDLCLNK